MTIKTNPSAKMNCSFCGAAKEEVGCLIAGPNVFICEGCADFAKQTAKEYHIGQKEADGMSSGVPTPREIDEYLGRYVIGQERARRTLAVAVHNHYVRLDQKGDEDEVELSKSNVLLIGPTGTGKTYIAQALARMLDVPFAISDATTLTQAGYVGEDVESIVSKLYQAADGDVERTQRGIIYIDEIDKISRKGDSASLTRDVSGEGVQQALLKLIEGTVASVPPHGGRKNPDQATVKIDTSNILFICGGAFPGLEKIIADRIEDKSIGFFGKVDRGDSDDLGMMLSKRTAEDLTRFGLIPEFVGRLPVIATLTGLDEAALKRILTEPKDAIVRQYRHMFGLKNVELEFTDDGLDAIAKAALARKTGARGLRSIIEDMLIDTMFDLPDIAGEVSTIRVDRATIDTDAEPIRVPRGDNDEGSALREAV